MSQRARSVGLVAAVADLAAAVVATTAVTAAVVVVVRGEAAGSVAVVVVVNEQRRCIYLGQNMEYCPVGTLWRCSLR